jgi:AcrR family transcriptional regulator
MRPQQSTDGRIARGIRTRQAIVEAHTELVRDGVLKPTAQLIADRAGVSVRTIWTSFADLEALLEATTERWLDLDAEIWEPVDPALPLAERIDVFCRRRADRVEQIGPGARSSALGEPFSPALRAAREQHVQRLRDDLDHSFGADLGPRSRQPTAYEELYVAASWPTWSALVDDLGLTRDQALRTTTAVFRRVLLPASKD